VIFQIVQINKSASTSVPSIQQRSGFDGDFSVIDCKAKRDGLARSSAMVLDRVPTVGLELIL
jgi:hypothetical protein